MNEERWRRVDDLLQAAFELPDDRRPAYLDSACGDDPELRLQVERLLAADNAAGGFLDAPPLAELESALADTARARRGDPLEPGAEVGRYRVEAKVGEGGMGSVYAAWDPELDRAIALKLVHVEEPAGRSRLRLLREAQALARVSHPNVVTVHDVGSHGESVFLAMEYVAGGTLEGWLRSSPHGWREVVAAFAAAGRGLAAAHAAGIVHRDFKPSNVLRDDDGRLRVADFGLARPAEVTPPTAETPSPEPGEEDGTPAPARRPRSGTAAGSLTGTGWAVGTPGYMAPEQHRGGEVGPASDQFAFCVALYHALYGEHPFGAGPPAETRRRVLAGEVSPPPRGTRVPRWLRAALVRGLAARPADRWPSMSELVRRLERGAARRLRRWAAAAALGAVALGTAVWIGSGGFEPPAGPVPSRSVAVLPFAEPDAGSGDTSLSQGITDALIHGLLRFDSLRVPARTSVYALDGRGLTLRQFGDRLAVDHVLTGTVRQTGDRLEVTARLVEVAGGRPLWSQSYDRGMAELLDLPDEIAGAVAERLGVGSEPSGRRLGGRPTDDLTAYSLYLKGRMHWNRRTAEGLRLAAEFFHRAIDEDPGFALAYSGLADAYTWMPTYDPQADPEAPARARAAALRALELAPDSAEANASLGAVLAAAGDLAGAEARFRRAIELEPRYATAHHWYGALLVRELHRPRAGVAELELARELDPASSIIVEMLIGAYHEAGLHQRALDTALELRVLDPEWRSCLARSYNALGRWDEAVASVEPGELGELSALCLSELATAHHFRGDYAAELELARRGLESHPGHPVLLGAEGGALAAAGRVDEAEELFEAILAESGAAGDAWYALSTLLGELRVHGHAAEGRRLAGGLAARLARDSAADGDYGSASRLALALGEAGRTERGAAVLGRWLATAGAEQKRRSRLSQRELLGLEGWTAALAGRDAAARGLVRRLDALEAGSRTRPFAAMIYAALGDRDRALEALRERLVEGLVADRQLHLEPGLEPLRGDPRLRRLLPAAGDRRLAAVRDRSSGT